MAYTLIDLQTGLKELWAKIKEALSSKQDTLSSGDNISIKDNTVSCTIDTGSFVTTSTLDGYLPLTGGHLSGKLYCDESVDVQGDLSCFSNTDLENLNVNKSTHLYGGTTINKNIYISSAKINLSGSNTLSVTDDLTFDSGGMYFVLDSSSIDLDFTQNSTIEYLDIASVTYHGRTNIEFDSNTDINFEGDTAMSFGSNNSYITMTGANNYISISGSDGYIQLPSGIKIY